MRICKQICVTIALALVVAIAAVHGEVASAAEKGKLKGEGGVLPEDVQLLSDTACKVVEQAPGPYGEAPTGFTLICQDPGQGRPAPQLACADVLTGVGNGTTVDKCLASCAQCAIPAAKIGRFDNNLDAQCMTMCATNGTCPQGKKCVLDKVLTKTQVPFCLKGAKACAATPATPDYCIKVEYVGECTCKCV